MLLPLALRPGDEGELRRLAAARRGDAGLARRARIVLLAAEGLPHTEIAQRAGTSVPMVREWRSRYSSGGIGALRDLPRSGRPATVDKTEILVRTLEPPPRRLGVTHWSSRLLAGELGLPDVKVAQVWREWGLAPWRAESFKFSTGPRLEAKVRDVIGLYLNPPDKAVVLCVDEKPQAQALERAAPVLPWRPRIPEKRSHDYIRHGTTTLFAALEAATGTVTRRLLPPAPARGVPGLPAPDREGLPAPQAASRLRQLRHAQPPGRAGLAREAPQDPLALHADVRILAAW